MKIGSALDGTNDVLMFDEFFFHLRKDFLSRIVKDELREMDMDIELQVQFYAEIEQEILQWSVTQFRMWNVGTKKRSFTNNKFEIFPGQ